MNGAPFTHRMPPWTSVLPGLVLLVSGCATPQYALRSVPQPIESAQILQIEQAISEEQAKTFERMGAFGIAAGERVSGFDVTAVLHHLAWVSERPSLPYRVVVFHHADPNAAALADGRVYISTGMLEYLEQRGGREDELAFVVSHELAHTVAQHLVKRYQNLYQRQLLMRVVATGAALAQGAIGGVGGEAGRMAINAASIINNLAISGYSQEQELEADQLGIRYMIRAGFNPEDGLDLLQDFSRFETPLALFRTHPYARERLWHLQRYLAERGGASPPSSEPLGRHPDTAERVQRLQAVQQQYPEGSVSWENLQRQIKALEDSLP